MHPSPQTIAAWIGQLIQAHLVRCDEAYPHSDDCPAHIIADAPDTRAMVESVVGPIDAAATELTLRLEGGQMFRIVVEAQ